MPEAQVVTRTESKGRGAQAAPRDIEVKVRNTAGNRAVVKEWQEAQLAKKAAEKRAERATEALDEMLGNPEPLERGQRMLVRLGKELALKLTGRRRTNIRMADLMQGWPEAFQACSFESEYNERSPL